MKIKFFKIFFRYSVISIFAVGLATLGIDAADHRADISGSIIGRFLKTDSAPCPADMALVQNDKGGFCIDRFEASAGDACSFPDPSIQSETKSNLDIPDCKPASKENSIPWRNISAVQAQIACAKAGKYLPVSEEWFVAALGTPDKSADWSADDCQVQNNWSSQPGKTGSGKNCVSAAGAYDMVGNVWEWVKGDVKDGALDGTALPEQGYITAVTSGGEPIGTDANDKNENYNADFFWIKRSETRGIMRGGYFGNGEGAGIFSFYAVSPPEFAGSGVGFRCAKQVK
jgi:formylglycine-generating enzyme required for sulfatase activity